MNKNDLNEARTNPDFFNIFRSSNAKFNKKSKYRDDV